MRRLGLIGMLIGLAIFLILIFVPWGIPYFDTEPLKYEVISYIERGQPGERFERLVWGWSEDGTKLIDLAQNEYVCPYPFPIGRVIVKNIETPPSYETPFSEGDKERLVTLTQIQEKMGFIYEQHFSQNAWKQKPLWEKAGRSIISVMPLSTVWRRFIPAFEYGITQEDARSLLAQVYCEIKALEYKRKATSAGVFEVQFTFRNLNSGNTYSSSDTTGLIMPGEAGTVEYRVYEINMDNDKWSWKHKITPDVKWVTKHKTVSLHYYLEYMLSRF